MAIAGVERQTKRTDDQRVGLITGVVGPMPKMQRSAFESLFNEAKDVAKGYWR